jgi:hypothetical protein
MIDFAILLGAEPKPAAALPRLLGALRAFAPDAFDAIAPTLAAMPPAALVEPAHAFWDTPESVAFLSLIFAALDAAELPSNDGIEPVAICAACRVESSSFIAGRRDWRGEHCPDCSEVSQAS